jgi:hypothetical protein
MQSSLRRSEERDNLLIPFLELGNGSQASEIAVTMRRRFLASKYTPIFFYV